MGEFGIRFFFPIVNPNKFLVTQWCQGEGTLTGSSVNVSREFQIKPRNITVKNYNLSIDINVDSTIFTDSGIRADYDSQRIVQQEMIQMKCSQISKDRVKEGAKYEDCRWQNFHKTTGCYVNVYLSFLVMRVILLNNRNYIFLILYHSDKCAKKCVKNN